MRSDVIKKGLERAPHRSLLYAMGLMNEELDAPLIGVANSFNELIPGHVHLRKIADAVKDGIRLAGGTPMEFNTIGICDGIAMNHGGMKYSLPSRELIADSVELVARVYNFDALVLIASCDKIIPGMLMAAARLNIPAIFVSGGPMLPGRYAGKWVDVKDVFEAVGAYRAGKINKEQLKMIEMQACPGCGSCAGMFTANTMNVLSEALGISLPFNGTTPAVYAHRIRIAKQTGTMAVRLAEEELRVRDILIQEAFEDAIAVDMALGGSTNTLLHLTAIARESGVNISLDTFDEISEKTPTLAKLSPSGEHHVVDLYEAGGVMAVMKELSRKGLIHGSRKTVALRTVGELLENVSVMRREVIRSIDLPYSPRGSLLILRGSLAPDGAVIKISGVGEGLHIFEGTAQVFESEEEATRAIMNREIENGSVIVIRYEGPKGGPGMREMLTPTSLISGMNMDREVALITDGRFSGATRGITVGHISPEAAEGGPIAMVKNGDAIRINLKTKRIDLMISPEEMEKRKREWSPKKKELTGYLRRYASLVKSTPQGATF